MLRALPHAYELFTVLDGIDGAPGDRERHGGTARREAENLNAGRNPRRAPRARWGWRGDDTR